MSKAITLESKIELFRDLLVEIRNIGDFRYGILDCVVMMALGFTPQSWSRHRPKLIQYCQIYNLTKEEVREGVTIETINITMEYDKKNKQWYGKRNALRLKDDTISSYREMTPEELEKYDIVWFAENDFMYAHHTN